MTSTFNHTYNLDGVRRQTGNANFNSNSNEIIYLDRDQNRESVMEEDS